MFGIVSDIIQFLCSP